MHEQADTRHLPHDELVQLHGGAAQARVAADLFGQGDDLALASQGRPRSIRIVFGPGDPFLPDHQVSVQAAASTVDRDIGLADPAWHLDRRDAGDSIGLQER